jgi:hypothetical protein
MNWNLQGFRAHRGWAAASLGLALMLVCVGCGGGDGLNRQAVTGKVAVDGKPIPNGSIGFEPLSPGGIGSGAIITNGTYSISQAEGLPPGKYRVTISGNEGNQFQSSAGTMPGDEDMPMTKDLVPPGWNKDGAHDVEVKDSGSNEFNFEIKSK